MNNTRSRMTCQRRVILEELQKTRVHPTAEQLHECVRQRLPRISLGTVYRNLELLSETGAILRLDVGEGRRRYDGNIRVTHYHGHCLDCGSVKDIPQAAVERLDYNREAAPGFTVTGHQLMFTGFCERCRTRRTRSSDESGE